MEVTKIMKDMKRQEMKLEEIRMQYLDIQKFMNASNKIS